MLFGDVALQLYNWIIRTGRTTESKSMEGYGYSSLAMFYLLRKNDYKKAVECFELHHDLVKKEGDDKEAKALLYDGLGLAFLSLGDFEAAIDYFDQKMRVIQGLEDKTQERVKAYVMLHDIYNRLAKACVILGDYRKALESHEKQLSIAQEVKDKAAKGRAHGNIGDDYFYLWDFRSAIDHYNLQLRHAKEVGDKAEEGDSYCNLGEAYCQLSEFQKAIDFHNLHLAIAKDLGDKIEEGRALGNLGAVYAALCDFKKATDFHTLHLRIAQEEEEKVDEAQAYYGLGDCFESLGLLSESLKCFQSSVTIFNQLTDRLQKMSLRIECNASVSSLCRVLLKQDKIHEALIAADEGRAQALSDLVESRYRVEKRSSTGPRGQQDNYLEGFSPSCTVFMAVDKRTVNIWVLRDEGQVDFDKQELNDPYSLDGPLTFNRSLIQAAYKEIGVGGGVQCENRSMDVVREDPIVQGIGGESSQNSLAQASSLSILHNILIKPISHLVQSSELVIVPDGPLWLAPYAAFKDSDSKYLCESFRIRLIPSLASLKMIADCHEEYHCTSGVLLLGDPWLAEVTNRRGQRLLEQLDVSKQEVEMIGEILKVPPLTGEDATKAEVSKRLGSVALVHIAAHCRMETGEIALTPDPERTSAILTKDDYLLTMADVSRVKLRAKLVVLSCCHSRRGEIKEEGVVGVAQAFIGAGARSVLVSLWAIDDQATLEFMRGFYHHLVKGKSASESLNLAVKSLRESDKYSDAKYWAPFVLIGDDVTLEFDQKK